jgi:hypothetical protein
MKKLIFSLLLAAATVTGHAQGTFNFANTVGGVDEVVTRATDGALLGDDYTASLFWATGNVSNAGLLSLFVGADTPFVTATGSSGTPGTGLFELGQLIMPVGSGTVITVQVRAWLTSAGSYANAVTTSAFHGFSNLVPLTLGDSFTSPDMVGLQPFAVTVPEPTTMLLGGFGAAALLLFRRRK